MSLADRIDACRHFDAAAYRPFRVAGHDVGRMRHGFAEELRAWPEVFAVADDAVALSDGLSAPDTRTAAVAAVLEDFRAQGRVPGWRGEHYSVSQGFHAEPLMSIERAAVPLFGTMGYGVHLNGYVLKPEGLFMWVGKRSMSKPTGPGKFDQMVGGGQPVGITVRDNLIKECAEEAGMAPALAAKAVSVGTVSYLTERPEGLRHDVLFNYDILLPDEFAPTPTDGEVDAFYLWPIADIVERIRDSDDFKFNAALVILDFAVRHGVLGPDDPEYVTVTEGLRMGRAGAYAVR